MNRLSHTKKGAGNPAPFKLLQFPATLVDHDCLIAPIDDLSALEGDARRWPSANNQSHAHRRDYA